MSSTEPATHPVLSFVAAMAEAAEAAVRQHIPFAEARDRAAFALDAHYAAAGLLTDTTPKEHDDGPHA